MSSKRSITISIPIILLLLLLTLNSMKEEYFCEHESIKAFKQKVLLNPHILDANPYSNMDE
jgi:hypothetical protein